MHLSKPVKKSLISKSVNLYSQADMYINKWMISGNHQQLKIEAIAYVALLSMDPIKNSLELSLKLMKLMDASLSHHTEMYYLIVMTQIYIKSVM